MTPQRFSPDIRSPGVELGIAGENSAEPVDLAPQNRASKR